MAGDNFLLSRADRIQRSLLMLSRILMICCGALLMIAGLAKLIASMGSAEALSLGDPILIISYRRLFVVIGSIEIATALFCIFSKRIEMQSALVAYLATCFCIYRI